VDIFATWSVSDGIVLPDELATLAIGIDVDAGDTRLTRQALLHFEYGGQVVAVGVVRDQRQSRSDQRVFVGPGALLEHRHLADDPLLLSRNDGGDAPGGGCAATVIVQLRERYGVQ